MDPSTFAEKEVFKRTIKDMAIDFNMEINFQEAFKEAYRAYTPKNLSDDSLAALISIYRSHIDPTTQTLRFNTLPPSTSASTLHFHLLVCALALYLDLKPDTGLTSKPPPLAGTIPDMASTTEHFVHLQSIYQHQAREEGSLFRAVLDGVLREAGLPTDHIPQEEVEVFTKNATNFLSVCTGSMEKELSDSVEEELKERVKDVLENDLFEDPAQTPILWYIALRAVDSFERKHARLPGDLLSFGGCEEAPLLKKDLDEVLQLLQRICEDYEVSGFFDNSAVEENVEGEASMDVEEPRAIRLVDYAQEVVRYGGCELHHISSVVGGIASQEAVKIITHQYLPINNTYVYNGINSCGATYQL